MSKGFPKEEIYGLTHQLRRCVPAIPANIAEGCSKQSQKEPGNFLNIALGSANETEYFLLLSKDLNYLRTEDHTAVNNKVNEIKAMLISLVQKFVQRLEMFRPHAWCADLQRRT